MFSWPIECTASHVSPFFIGKRTHTWSYGTAFRPHSLPAVVVTPACFCHISHLEYCMTRAAGDEVVFAYFSPSQVPEVGAVQKQLFGFQRVHLAPGGSVCMYACMHVDGWMNE
eukprot:m.1368940 g.1368940  ORF g.1368940 m.1368940 type:complete len:113 (+) comp24955_c1_seq14:2281-2619(+)